MGEAAAADFLFNILIIVGSVSLFLGTLAVAAVIVSAVAERETRGHNRHLHGPG